MKTDITYKGQVIGSLNSDLIKEKGLTTKEVEKLKRLHIARHELFLAMEATDDRKKLRIMANTLQEIEFDMQTAWRAPRNANNHTWWFRAPKCTCGTMDNRERVGTPFRSIDSGCPLHGSEE